MSDHYEMQIGDLKDQIAELESTIEHLQAAIVCVCDKRSYDYNDLNILRSRLSYIVDKK